METYRQKHFLQKFRFKRSRSVGSSSSDASQLELNTATNGTISPEIHKTLSQNPVGIQRFISKVCLFSGGGIAATLGVAQALSAITPDMDPMLFLGGGFVLSMI